MINNFTTTITRDFSVLTQRRLFSWVMAFWAFVCAFIFFAYIEDFLTIQAALRGKNSQYGVTDLIIIPYIKTLGIVGMLIIISLCSRLFSNEHFSAFSTLYRSMNPRPISLIIAKIAYVATMSFAVIFILAIAPLISYFFIQYNLSRVIVTLLSQFVLIFSVGLLAMVFSQLFKHSVLVVLVTGIIVFSTELAVRLIVEPVWVASIVAFFSPLAHINRIATGVVTLSDAVFFMLLWAIHFYIALRQFNNTYSTSS